MTRPSALVALTFDDGPSEWTQPILEVLSEHRAHATFFAVGAFAAARSAVVRKLVSGGHELANHTHDHVNLQAASDSEIDHQIRAAQDAIEAAAGVSPRFFRAPFFRKDGRVLRRVAEHGLVDVGADVYPLDWDPAVDAETIVRRVLTGVGPRSIVCLHDGIPPRRQTDRVDCTPTLDAVRRLLPELRDRGYRCVTVTELLGWTPARDG